MVFGSPNKKEHQKTTSIPFTTFSKCSSLYNGWFLRATFKLFLHPSSFDATVC
jgi:hypothetical protein